MDKFYKILNKTTLDEATSERVKCGSTVIENPSLDLLHKLGYWPIDPDLPQPPESEEDYKIFDDGYIYQTIDGANKIVTRRYRKLKIVDPYKDVIIRPDQEVMEDRWTETETEYIHIMKIYDVIDEKPEIDETTHHLKEKIWDLDDVNKKKIARYVIVRRVDEKPVLEDKEEIVGDWWDYKILPEHDDVPEEEVYCHFYKVMTVIRNPPTLEEDEQIVDEWFTDDEETDTRTYHYKVMKVIDNKPILEEGQEIIESWYTDDETTNTRTYHYEVRYIVDDPPDLTENEKIEAEWWDDDGVTRTHRYEVHQYIDEPPVLYPGQDYISDRWEVDDRDPYHIVHTHVYEVRFIVDHAEPELDEKHFIYQDYWHDDGTNYEHIWDVWEYYDEPRPEVDEYWNRIVDLGIVDDPEKKTRGQKWFIKRILRNKPEDDPEGNFKWVEDGEVDHGDYIEVLYKQVFKVWRLFSKLKLEGALFELGLLDKFDAYIDNLTMTNKFGQTVKVRRFYNQANDLSENHPLFKPYYKDALNAFGITEEQGEAILEQCVIDPNSVDVG